MRILIMSLYLAASVVLFGAAWYARPAGFMPLILLISVAHTLVGLVVWQRLFGRDGR